MTGFVQGIFGAFSDVFINVHIRGGFFHFGQCIWRKIQNLPDLREKYMNNVDFALKIKQLIALAFILVHGTRNKFDELMSHFFEDHEALLLPTALKRHGLEDQLHGKSVNHLLLVWNYEINMMVHLLGCQKQITMLKVGKEHFHHY